MAYVLYHNGANATVAGDPGQDFLLIGLMGLPINQVSPANVLVLPGRQSNFELSHVSCGCLSPQKENMHVIHKQLLSGLLAIHSINLLAQSPSQATEWLTTPDRSALISSQDKKLTFRPEGNPNQNSVIVIDKGQKMQAIDGFGFAMTGGSAQLIMRMTPEKRAALLEELFGTAAGSIGVSYLRLTVGSSDMNDHVFTYDDLPAGQTDVKLKHFKLGPDLNDVVPLMQQILQINPSLKILATPWSAPSWMKTNQEPKAGSLKPEFYQVYANYLARYIREMRKHDIRIDAITPQNEPLNPKNTPSMVLTAEEEDTFIKQALGPVFHKKHLSAKIIVYDHNCDRPDYPMTILADKDAAQYVDGSGFHLYGGTIDAMTKVHDAYPAKNLYFTEQMVIDRPKAGIELRIAQPVAHIVIGAIANWSRNVLLWNLAADSSFGPHTSDGGCPICEGAITIDGDTVTRNLAFYTVGQVSRFVRPGAFRINTTGAGAAPAHVAFLNADGSTVLLVSNTTDASQHFAIRSNGEIADADLPAGAVATYVW